MNSITIEHSIPVYQQSTYAVAVVMVHATMTRILTNAGLPAWSHLETVTYVLHHPKLGPTTSP